MNYANLITPALGLGDVTRCCSGQPVAGTGAKFATPLHTRSGVGRCSLFTVLSTLELHNDDGRNIIRVPDFSGFTYPQRIALNIDDGTYIFLLNSKFCDSSGPQSTYIKFPKMKY